MYPVFRCTIVIFTLFVATIMPSYSLSQFTDNPGGDQPDESSVLGDAIYPTKLEGVSLNLDKKSKVSILESGYSREAGLFLGLYLPIKIISETEFPLHASSTSLFVIPSGGLSSVKDKEGFRVALNKFVEEGGILFVFAQRFGSDYAILPNPFRQILRGYGWLEDQSSLSHSAILTMQHPITSRLTTSRPHLNIDGFFESVPDKSKPLLRNSINLQPILIVYKYGNGSVIVSALFTDWAYTHLRATWDEVILFSGILRWARITLTPSVSLEPAGKGSIAISSVSLPAVGFSVQSDNEVYMAGSSATFTIKLWNNEDRRRKISVYYDGIGEDADLQPYGTAQLTYSIPVYSTRRLWVYFYDEEKIFLQTLKRGYSVIYPTSGDK